MINTEGWICLHRVLLESDMWKALTSMQRDLLINCLLKANYKSAQWEWQGSPFKCEPGQFVTSLENLKDLCAKGTSVKMVRGGLDKLSKWGFLAYDGAKTGTKISIINWATYQNIGTLQGIPQGKIRASSGQEEGKIRATNNKNTTSINNNKQTLDSILEIDLETEFNKIYSIYPNKSSKSKALKYFETMELDREIIAKMHAVINYSKKSKKWEKTQFVPYLVNWLMNKEYLDDIPVSSTQKPVALPLVEIKERIKCNKHGIKTIRAFTRGGVIVDRDLCPECYDTKEEAI